MAEERLDRLLSATGAYSRSEARALIRAGAVTVGGAPVTKPETRVGRDREILVRGQRVDAAEFVYWLLHKPAGYVSASKDERWPAVTRLLPEEARRRNVFCVGRLDADATGLLLLTDDGDYAHRVTAPRAGIEKTYEVRLDGPLGPADAQALAKGVTWTDGTEYRPARLVPDADDPCRARVTVTEGRFHEVKRLMASRGREVLSLKRLSVGALTLPEDLPEGAARRLSPTEAGLVFHKNV